MSILNFIRKKPKSLFIYDEENNIYTATINNIRFECDVLKDNYEELAVTLSKKYYNKLDFLADEMIDEIKAFFGELSKDDLISSLNSPLINLDMSVMSYLEHTLDDVHIIDVEFDGFFDNIFEVRIDG